MVLTDRTGSSPVSGNLRLLLAVVSAVLLALALPNELFSLGSPLFGTVALAPLLVALYHTPSYRQAVGIGAVFGTLSSLLTNYWLLFFQDFSVWTLGGVTLAYLGWHALLAPILRFTSSVPATYRPFAIAAVWALYEYLKSSGFLGYPWGLIAYPVHGLTPLIQLVDITGVWGLSLLMALVNAIAAEWLEPALYPRGTPIPAHRWRGTAAVACLVAAALGYGTAALGREIPATGTADLVLVQHNSNPWLTGDAEETVETLQRLTADAIAARRHPPDLVVWSETAVTYPVLPGGETTQPRVPAAVTGLSVPLLTGIPWLLEHDPVQAMNAALLVGPGGRVLDHYGKRHLVPFAESVPFWEVPAVRRFFNDVVGLHATWAAGSRWTVFALPLRAGGTLRFAAPICFEDSFPYINRRFVRAGADLLINLTNDAWSRTVSAETQHLVAAKLRAVENRRVLVRATNGGVTTAIDPWGRVIGSPAPLFTEYALRLQVPVYRPTHPTVYTRFGDYLPAVIAAGLLALFGALVAARRTGSRSGRRGGRDGSADRIPPADGPR